jgi:hypothetical protein
MPVEFSMLKTYLYSVLTVVLLTITKVQKHPRRMNG